jgi:hypothetical protein
MQFISFTQVYGASYLLISSMLYSFLKKNIGNYSARPAAVNPSDNSRVDRFHSKIQKELLYIGHSIHVTLALYLLNVDYVGNTFSDAIGLQGRVDSLKPYLDFDPIVFLIGNHFSLMMGLIFYLKLRKSNATDAMLTILFFIFITLILSFIAPSLREKSSIKDSIQEPDVQNNVIRETLSKNNHETLKPTSYTPPVEEITPEMESNLSKEDKEYDLCDTFPGWLCIPLKILFFVIEVLA